MKSVFSRKTVFLSLGILSILTFVAVYPMLSNSLTSRDECTSWIALGNALDSELLANNKIILHKNRDLSDDDPDNHQFQNIKNGLYKYIAMTNNNDPDSVYVWAGVNETGLAAATNLGQGANMYGSIGGPTTCREILENCATVECAWQWISDNKSRYFYENIMLIAQPPRGTEPAKGAVVEIHSKSTWGGIEITSLEQSLFESDQHAVIDVDDDGNHIVDFDGSTINIENKPGVDFRSNHFKVLSNSVFGITDNSEDRYTRLLTSLAKTPAEGGYYGAINVNNSQEIGSWFARDDNEDAFCRTSTLGRITIEVDGNNPLDSILYHGNGYNDTYPEYSCNQETPDDNYFDPDPYESHIYTFSGVQQNNTYPNIYACDVDKFPFGGNTNNLNTKVELTTTAYGAVTLPDGNTWTTVDPGGSYYDSDEMMLWVETQISEEPEDIERIEFVFQGYSSQDNDFLIYVKTDTGAYQNDSSWLQLGTASNFESNGNDSIRRVLSSNIADYVDDNKVIRWMVGTPEGHSDTITVDLIKVEVFLK